MLLFITMLLLAAVERTVPEVDVLVRVLLIAEEEKSAKVTERSDGVRIGR